MRGVEAEFDQVKASFKARTAECEARIDSLSTGLINGFDMRPERCVVVFRPADRKKDFYLEADYKANTDGLGLVPAPSAKLPALIEDMTWDDFQADLLQAESAFDAREEIELFKPAAGDEGKLVVGRLAGKWFSALRVKIGKMELTERLDAEQKCVKERSAAISISVKRFQKWAKDNLKDLAKGFETAAEEIIEAHKERAE